MQVLILIFSALAVIFAVILLKYNSSLQKSMDTLIAENQRLQEEQEKLKEKFQSLLKRKRDLASAGISKDAVRKELKRLMADLLDDADVSKLMGLLEQDKLMHEMLSESKSSPRLHEYKLATEDVEDIIREIRKKQNA